MQFFSFGFGGDTATDDTSVELLGGKGAGLLWLAQEGVPVPPGFVIPTSVWAEYDKKPKTTMKAIAKALPAYLYKLEAHFGYMPLLSVRSGARVSCPGMMDTILNVGIETANVAEWTNRLGPKCFADSFQRLVSMYGSVVNGLRKESLGGSLKSALDEYQTQTGATFPDAEAQLLGAIEAVFKSWDNDRADFYRKANKYERSWGTAVTVQAMVFGNLNDQSGTGVLFTRNPDTGGSLVTGEFLSGVQGEDIVAGGATPKPLDAMKEWNPTLHDELLATVIALENKQRDMLDIEFTVQDGKLYLLQVRKGKRSATAAIKIAVDMHKQGLIDAKTAVQRVTMKQFDIAQMLTLDPKFTKEPAFTGIGACSGVVTGKPVFSKEEAINCTEPCILVTQETTPEDIAGMAKARGVITMVGGLTSHAAVVARAMDRACIVGVGQSVESFKDVEVLSMDGGAGRIWTEKVPTVGGTTAAVQEFNTLVCETLGVVPVLFDAPVEKLDEALLYLGDKILDTKAAWATVIKTLNKVNRVYLDLVPSDQEARYLGLVSKADYTGRLLAMLEGTDVGSKLSRLTLIAKAEHKSNLKRIAPGADLRSLVLSDKELVLDGVDMTDPAIQRVLSWKQQEGGFNVISLGSYLPTAKSMISVSHALQILNEGV